MFNRARKPTEEVKGPAETCQLSENVEGQLWVRVRQDGTRRIDFSLGRQNPSGRSWRTFRPHDLLEFPAALSTMAAALSKATDQPRELREQLAYLADLLAKVAEVSTLVPLKAVNGHAEEAAEARILP